MKKNGTKRFLELVKQASLDFVSTLNSKSLVSMENILTKFEILPFTEYSTMQLQMD